MAKQKGNRMIANNKKAYHDYFIEDKYEAGISLAGTEVKSLRMGKCSIKEAYAKMTGEGIRAVLRGIYTDIKSGNVMGEALSITEYNGYICSVVTKKDQDMGVIF